MITPAFLKLPEAVVYSALGRSTLYELIKSGDLISRTVGTSRIISRASLDEFLAKQPSYPPVGKKRTIAQPQGPIARGGNKRKEVVS